MGALTIKEAVEDLFKEQMYQNGNKEEGVSVEFLMRMTLLRYYCGTWSADNAFVREAVLYLTSAPYLKNRAEKKAMSLTTDPTTPCLHEIDPETGQNRCYLVLSDDELARGFQRPVREWYRHRKCGKKTKMPTKIAETYARDISFYNSTWCCSCKAHHRLLKDGLRQFEWLGADGEPDGSLVGE